ncbi:hypothetical protein ACFWPH_34510 [Nocardia sp. NPDC058499]
MDHWRRPDIVFGLLHLLGHRHYTGKAQDLLGWNPRPVRETIIDTAE